MPGVLIPLVLGVFEKIGGYVFDEVTKSSITSKISSLASGSGLIGGILTAVESSVGKIEDIKRLEIQAHLQTLLGQISLDSEEGKDESKFKSCWRPFIAWGLGVIIVLHGLISEVINILHLFHIEISQIAPIDSTSLAIMMSLLGIYTAARTVEKGR